MMHQFLPARTGLFAILLPLMLLMASCVGTRYVPEGEQLLSRVEVKIGNPEINREELMSYVRQRGNTRILGFLKFHMWLYNLSSPDKPDGWLKRTGEAPQIYEEGLATQSCEQIRQYLYNKGYYDASVTYDAEPRRKTGKAISHIKSTRVIPGGSAMCSMRLVTASCTGYSVLITGH